MKMKKKATKLKKLFFFSEQMKNTTKKTHMLELICDIYYKNNEKGKLFSLAWSSY